MSRVQFSNRKSTKHIVVHCAATKPSMNIGAKEIGQWHQQKGWLAIGYHYVIRRDGQLEIGRPREALGSHVRGHNDSSLGICLVGGIDDQGKPEDNFTAAQKVTLNGLLKELKSVHYPDAQIIGHRDLDPGKACPSFDVAKYLKAQPKDA
jgi:N-acetylmuramoyl-L-alanine amidase